MSPVAESSNPSATDGRSEGRMQKYADFWDSDMKKEEKSHTENRLENYTEVINGTSPHLSHITPFSSSPL